MKHMGVAATIVVVAGLSLLALSSISSPGPLPAPNSASPVLMPSTSGPGTLISVHSPGHVANDLVLQPGQCHVIVKDATAGFYLPDPVCTPGAIDPMVTDANLDSTICRSGYTKTVRPPASETNRFKTLSLAQYGMNYSSTTEFDHQIPLELGGANSVSNLWPEPNATDATGFHNPKDVVENRLNRAVCSRQITLQAAQIAMATDWTTAEHTLGLSH